MTTELSDATKIVSSITNPVPTNMTLIPAGEFLMGSEMGSDAEKPVHRVFLDHFCLDIRLVSNGDFLKFAELTGYLTSAERADSHRTWRSYCSADRMDHPVILVSWHDAVEFANWAGKRLPTEAEWEKAARSGRREESFPWGNEPPDSRRVNWLRTAGVSGAPPTVSVASSKPNGFGLTDMAGNVWQWCSDWYEDGYYEVSCERNPVGPGRGRLRVRRGGAWNVREAFRLRCANRGAMNPEARWPNLGFRCATSVCNHDAI